MFLYDVSFLNTFFQSLSIWYDSGIMSRSGYLCPLTCSSKQLYLFYFISFHFTCYPNGWFFLTEIDLFFHFSGFIYITLKKRESSCMACLSVASHFEKWAVCYDRLSKNVICRQVSVRTYVLCSLYVVSVFFLLLEVVKKTRCWKGSHTGDWGEEFFTALHVLLTFLNTCCALEMS